MRDDRASQFQMGVGYIERYLHAMISIDDRFVEWFV